MAVTKLGISRRWFQHINLPDRCSRTVGNWRASRLLTRGSNRLTDDRRMRAARLPGLLSYFIGTHIWV